MFESLAVEDPEHLVLTSRGGTRCPQTHREDSQKIHNVKKLVCNDSLQTSAPVICNILFHGMYNMIRCIKPSPPYGNSERGRFPVNSRGCRESRRANLRYVP